jgi:hypothetical protein
MIIYMQESHLPRIASDRTIPQVEGLNNLWPGHACNSSIDTVKHEELKGCQPADIVWQQVCSRTECDLCRSHPAVAIQN